ncbi:hypothetical protein M8818_002954 [Zalaria obscura]|uniref:Uncharacterized protein n=1 Tax=Zalaria obscura TaxID=2024903 RepID=A0ACC3SJX8_9PEZI
MMVNSTGAAWIYRRAKGWSFCFLLIPKIFADRKAGLGSVLLQKWSDFWAETVRDPNNHAWSMDPWMNFDRLGLPGYTSRTAHGIGVLREDPAAYCRSITPPLGDSNTDSISHILSRPRVAAHHMYWQDQTWEVVCPIVPFSHMSPSYPSYPELREFHVDVGSNIPCFHVIHADDGWNTASTLPVLLNPRPVSPDEFGSVAGLFPAEACLKRVHPPAVSGARLRQAHKTSPSSFSHADIVSKSHRQFRTNSIDALLPRPKQYQTVDRFLNPATDTRLGNR